MRRVSHQFTKAMEKLTEGRKSVIRTLPSLAKAGGKFAGFRARENQSERMYKMLAGLIRRFRQATPRPFYSIRETMAYFKVSQTAVARVYRRLDKEGLLTLVRSSQTMIAARAPGALYKVRGVVCMPIWLPGFLYFLDWRKWFSQLEEELAHYHFVLEPIFYRSGEEMSQAFIDRVMRFNPNYLLWSWPCDTDRFPMQSIADAGVSLVAVHTPGEKYPGRSYRTSYDRAKQEGIRKWAASGEIDHVIVPHELGYPARSLASTRAMLKDTPLSYRFKPYSFMEKLSLLDYLRQLAPNRRTGVIFEDHFFYARMCAMLPKEMYAFLCRHRVMVTGQLTIHLPLLRPPPGITVDGIVFPWKKLARRVAMDLGKSKSGAPAKSSIVEAEWRPQIPLADMVQTVVDE